MSARARICAPGQTGVNPVGTIIPILDGDVRTDATAPIRSSVDMTTDGYRMWPTAATDLLVPYGNELFIERGVVLGDGTTEWVSQGYHRLYDVEQDKVPNGAIRLSGRDRMSGLIDARLLAPRQFAATASVFAVVTTLVQEVYPTVVIEFDFTATTTLLGTPHIAEEDRHGFLLDLITSLGKVWYWDHEGKLQIRSAPDPAAPVWDVNHGADGVLVRMSRALKRDGVYNIVVATGEAPGKEAGVRGVAYDDNPDSPTYWKGTFGQVPEFYNSPFITSQAQAQAAAHAKVRSKIGLPYSVDLTAVPNPASEVLDPVRVTYSDRDRVEIHVLERISMPLVSGGPMQATAREQSTVLIGLG